MEREQPIEKIRGSVQVHRRGFGFLNQPDGQSAFVAPPELNGFLTGDDVAAEVSFDEKGRANAKNLRLKKRGRKSLHGWVREHGSKRFLEADNSVSNTHLPLEGAADLPLGQLVRARVLEDKTGWQVAETLAEEQAWAGLLCDRHQLEPWFGPGEADNALESPSPRRGSHDLRELPTLTIDSADSRDLDDALAVLPADGQGGLRVLVLIADPARYLPAGEALDQGAKFRGTSVYLAGRVLPMLPPSLSHDQCSLLPEQERLALAIELRLGPGGKTLSVDLYPAQIRSNARLTYDEVDSFLRGEPDALERVPAQLHETLRWLRTASARLGAVRSFRGGIEWLREEAHVVLSAEGRAEAVKTRKQNLAHRLVERLMVAANEAVATWMAQRHLPLLYRAHEAPERRKVAQLEETSRHFGVYGGFGGEFSPLSLAAYHRQIEALPEFESLQSMLMRTLGPARYQKAPVGHFGLAAPAYCHVTSPIRRYADLFTHRLIFAYLEGERRFFREREELSELSEHLNQVGYRAKRAERERQQGLMLEVFGRKIGSQVQGRLVAIKSRGALIALQGGGLRGWVDEVDLGENQELSQDPPRLDGEFGSLTPGQLAAFEVSAVDAERGSLRLRWPEVPPA